MKEEWREIPSHPLYLASSKGRIKRVDRKLIRKTQKHKKTGYLYLNLQDKPWTDTRCAVHRLVCEAFHGTPKSKMDVNHINGVKDDNRPENLEWCTRSQNLLHKIYVLKKSNGGLPKRPVYCVETGESFPSVYSAEKAGNGNVYDSAKLGWASKGKHWKFCTNKEAKMIVKITAIVPKEDEAQFRQAMEDGDFIWMEALNPKWVEVVEDDEE